MKILIVDDEQDIVNVLELILENMGHEVTCATDGKTALDLIEVNDYQLLILDNYMPIMSGEEVLQEIYRRKDHKFKILFTSGQTINMLNLIDENEFFMIVDYILNKPFGIANIREALHELA